MNIAVLGTGVVGKTLSEKLLFLGHHIAMGSRDPKAALERTKPDYSGKAPLKEWLKHHKSIELTNLKDAAQHAVIIINATQGNGSISALETAGEENLSGKILLDVANPLDFTNDNNPSLFISNTDSLGEQIQNTFPESKVVKSLNTVNADIMINPQLLSGDHCVFLSGNDEDSKMKTRELIHSFGWEDNNIIDLGDITTARGTEQLLPLWLRLMNKLNTTKFNFNVVRKLSE